MDNFIIAGRTFASRLIVGTGKYSSPSVMVQAHEASGADMVTVAVRRVNVSDRSQPSLLDYIDTSKYFLLPNTAGCYTADEAVRTARLGREAGLSNWVKLERLAVERDRHGIACHFTAYNAMPSSTATSDSTGSCPRSCISVGG